jgi:outer membrane murein-binding lipoprotein Lpp
MKNITLTTLIAASLFLAACSNGEQENTITEQSKTIESQARTIESLETEVATLESATTESSKENNKTLTDAELDELIVDKVLIPDPTLKSREQVEAEFEAAGFTPNFVTAFGGGNDEYAGFCNRLGEQPGVLYISYSESRDRSGSYADEGATITVGYFEKQDE